jgi:hypothetical protein
VKIDPGVPANYRVEILQDSDGAAASCGTVRIVYESGRALVYLDCGGTRNLAASVLRSIDDRNAEQ